MLHLDNIFNIIIENNDHNEILRDIDARFWDLFDILLKDPNGISMSSYDVLCGLGMRINPLIMAEKKSSVHSTIENRFYLREET